MDKRFILISFFINSLFVDLPVFSQEGRLGVFDGHTDIGEVQHKSQAVYNQEREEYEITTPVTSSGNAKEAFNFIWKHINGDFIIYAHINRVENDTNSSLRL